jgi:SNF2 family DNA or RNA helicase
LTEYFSLLSFIIPGVLGTNADFRKKYELPILRGRDADATEIQRIKGEECLAELGALVNKFIIRRTAELLTKYCTSFLLCGLYLRSSHFTAFSTHKIRIHCILQDD